jgi:uncharacterized protein with ParB-like and HNH nuclease domain
MGLKPYDRKVSQIFNNIEYDVDFYQREYKWSDDLEYKPVSSLLKDIFYRFDLEKYNPHQTINSESTDKLEWYYLNSFMTNTIKGKKYIVDGQQRLTTLTLISISLYHLAEENNLENHVIDTLKYSILGNTEFGKTYWMGFKYRDRVLDDILVNNLSFKGKPSNISETNIYKNYLVVYNELKNNLDTSHKLLTFISYFRNRIYLIEIEIDKDKDVAMVFEVINDRGIPLKPYEILKGKLLSQIDIADRDHYIDIWEKQISSIEKFGEHEIDEFFGFYFRSKYADNADQYSRLDKSRYHKNIFLSDFSIKSGLKDNEGSVRDFIQNSLPYYVAIYTTMLKYYRDYVKEYEHIYFNSINDIDGQFLLVLSSISFNDAEMEDKLKIVPKLFDQMFVISRLTNSYRSNDFNTNVINLNTIIRNRSVESLESFFKNELLSIVRKSHDREDLLEPLRYEFFKNLGYNDFGKKFLRYFFSRIDHYISDFSNESEYGTYYQLVLQTKGALAYHIEHIIANNEENINLFENDEEMFNEQRNRLGGLLLLKGVDNQSSGKEIYSEKLKTYNVVGTYWARTLLSDMYHRKVTFKSFIESENLNFKSYEQYAKDEIEERHKLLFDLVERIWLK